MLRLRPRTRRASFKEFNSFNDEMEMMISRLLGSFHF